MKISFIIPAYNEQAYLGNTLAVLARSANELGEPYEIIVVDDASTDRTPSIARQFGAKLVSVQLRQIGAVRNAGARVAKGDVLCFVDADTAIPAETLIAAWQTVQSGAVGGGALVRMDGPLPFYAYLFLWGWQVTSRFHRWAAGCFVFVRKSAFEEVGGFNDQFFASEEIVLSQELKRLGRFVILNKWVVTSSRKTKQFSATSMIRLIWRVIRTRGQALYSRDELGMWYDVDR